MKVIKCVGCGKMFNYKKDFGVDIAIDTAKFAYYCFTCRNNGTETRQKRGCLNIGIYPK